MNCLPWIGTLIHEIMNINSNLLFLYLPLFFDQVNKYPSAKMFPVRNVLKLDKYLNLCEEFNRIKLLLGWLLQHYNKQLYIISNCIYINSNKPFLLCSPCFVVTDLYNFHCVLSNKICTIYIFYKEIFSHQFIIR